MSRDLTYFTDEFRLLFVIVFVLRGMWCDVLREVGCVGEYIQLLYI